MMGGGTGSYFKSLLNIKKYRRPQSHIIVNFNINLHVYMAQKLHNHIHVVDTDSKTHMT